MKQRHPFLILTVLAVILTGFWPVAAHSDDAADQQIYKVGDVMVDVTADSAAKARDQAIIDAQNAAFQQLLDRLGAPANLGAKLSPNDLATLVRNFEINSEKRSSVRYIGNFNVQFRPNAVRSFIASRHATFNDAPGTPVVVLPILHNGPRLLLWEEPTLWFKAWSDAAKSGGVIPLIVPSGSAEDKAAVNGFDAANGKVESMKSLVDTYHATSAAVAVFNASDDFSKGFTVDLQTFGDSYDPGSDIRHIKLAGVKDKKDLDKVFALGVKEVRKIIEKEQAEERAKEFAASGGTASPDDTNSDGSDRAVSVMSDIDRETSEHVVQLSVTAQFKTLAEWADMQKRLAASDGVRQVDVTSLGRGLTQINLGFVGSMDALQMSIFQHGLQLSQDVLSGHWMLKRS